MIGCSSEGSPETMPLMTRSCCGLSPRAGPLPGRVHAAQLGDSGSSSHKSQGPMQGSLSHCKGLCIDGQYGGLLSGGRAKSLTELPSVRTGVSAAQNQHHVSSKSVSHSGLVTITYQVHSILLLANINQPPDSSRRTPAGFPLASPSCSLTHPNMGLLVL